MSNDTLIHTRTGRAPAYALPRHHNFRSDGDRRIISNTGVAFIARRTDEEWPNQPSQHPSSRVIPVPVTNSRSRQHSKALPGRGCPSLCGSDDVKAAIRTPSVAGNAAGVALAPALLFSPTPQDKSSQEAGVARSPKNLPPGGETPCKTLEAHETLRRSAGAALNGTGDSVGLPIATDGGSTYRGAVTEPAPLTLGLVSTAGGPKPKDDALRGETIPASSDVERASIQGK